MYKKYLLMIGFGEIHLKNFMNNIFIQTMIMILVFCGKTNIFKKDRRQI